MSESKILLFFSDIPTAKDIKDGINSTNFSHALIAWQDVSSKNIVFALETGQKTTDTIEQFNNRYYHRTLKLYSDEVNNCNEYANPVNGHQVDVERMVTICSKWNEVAIPGKAYPNNCRGCVDAILRMCGYPERCCRTKAEREKMDKLLKDL
jgi:hypothetical protein